jgi:protein SCO1/2
MPAQAADQQYQRKMVQLTLPDVVLVNQDGEKVRLRSLLESETPVVVDFIYATCTTICPILSAGFTNLQRKAGAARERFHLVSVTIDPENDTPAIMKEYLARYRAQPGWDFLTGSRADINQVMNSFDAYFPAKMSHRPIYFIRTSTPGQWLRLDGMIDGQSLLAEVERTVNK